MTETLEERLDRLTEESWSLLKAASEHAIQKYEMGIELTDLELTTIQVYRSIKEIELTTIQTIRVLEENNKRRAELLNEIPY